MSGQVSCRPHSDMQIFIDGQLGKYPPILRDVAIVGGAVNADAGLSKLRGGAPASCQMMVPLSTGTFPVMQFMSVDLPMPQANNARTDALREIDIHVP